MKRFSGVVTRICTTCFVFVLAAPLASADPIWGVVSKVSLERYTAYQIDIESMGLGLYGGPAYNQGYRNRDGWASGGTLGNQETQLYLADQFTAMGLDVYIQGRYSNVVAELRGIRTPQNIYIVCAHYDTTGGNERPGGDDNASGTAGVLEAARVLTQYRFDSTLRFIGFNAEEDWMKGSQDYVDAVLVRNDENVVGVLNLDMILRPAWDSDPQQPVDLEVETGEFPDCLAWAGVFIDTAATYAPSLVIDPAAPHTQYWDAGDQGPFIAAGYPALMIIDNTAPEIWWRQANAYYHSAQDASDALANDPNSPSGVTYDYEFATDVVRTTVATLATQAGLVSPCAPSFDMWQTLATSGAADLEFFTIGNEAYLAVANKTDGSTYEVDSIIYRYNGAGFAEYQSIPTCGASDWEFFTIGSDHYLVVANMSNDDTYNVDSKVFRWDGAAFVPYQSIPTSGASDCESFTIGGSTYLAVANSYDDSTYNVDSRIYRWNGTSFAEFQAIPTKGASGFESFAVGNTALLAVANRYDGATYNVDSEIYHWNEDRFVSLQSIPTRGASDWESFTVDGGSYLAVANAYDGATHSTDSEIYKWGRNGLSHYQSIRTHGACDWAFLAVDGESYLAVANAGDSSPDEAVSMVYRWDGAQYAEFVAIPAGKASACESFVIGGDHFLGIAGARNATSALYRYRRPGTASLDEDCDVDLRDYAVFAASWRARKGQPQWKASCDLSAPADGVVDARDLAAFVENWLEGR